MCLSSFVALSASRGEKNQKSSSFTGGDTNEETWNQVEALWGTRNNHG